MADTVGNRILHLVSLDATLRRAKGLSPEGAFFFTKKGCGRTSKGDGTNGQSLGKKSEGILCHGCGKTGHIKPKCRNKDKLASYVAEKKSKVDANLASTELTPAANTKSFLFSIIQEDMVITVNVATEKQSAD